MIYARTHPKRTPTKGFTYILIERDMGVKVEEYTTGLLPGMGTARILFQNEVPASMEWKE